MKDNPHGWGVALETLKFGEPPRVPRTAEFKLRLLLSKKGNAIPSLTWHHSLSPPDVVTTMATTVQDPAVSKALIDWVNSHPNLSMGGTLTQ